MKTVVSVLIVIAMAFAVTGCTREMELASRDVLFQSSNFSALMAGVYEGDMSLWELSKQGDFGIGTFNGLDGELIMHGGAFYRIGADGIAYSFADEEMLRHTYVPFAAVTHFDTDQSVAVTGVIDYEQLQAHIDNFLRTKNVPVAIRIEGLFRSVRVRSVPRQTPPYAPLTQVTATQPVYEHRNVRGILVGFRLPQFMAGVNVPGYHLHFISQDRTYGGHVLDVELEGVNIQLDYTSEFEMVLPNNDLYQQSNFSSATAAQTSQVE
ncbi:MAG: acetolactate decarboxylase [Sedimentisphaerales bacterium]|nr:acetolactate decarboxylase [Sedimentisphaerales bacterium]